MQHIAGVKFCPSSELFRRNGHVPRKTVTAKCPHNICSPVRVDHAWVVQRMDNAIHWINHYPADSVVCFVNTYPLDSDLSSG